MKMKNILTVVLVMVMAIPAMSHMISDTTEAALTDPGDVTVTIYDIGGSRITDPDFFTELDGKLYFAGKADSVGEYSAELLVYDPVTDQITVAADVYPGTDGSGVREVVAHEGKIYFQAQAADMDSELYVYDPVTGQNNKIDLNPSGNAQPRYMFSASNGLLYFSARDADNDQELHEYDPGTGNFIVYEFFPGLSQYGTQNIAVPKVQCEYNGWLYLEAKDAEGSELHRFNMNTKAHSRITNIHPGYDLSGNGQNSYPQNAIVFNNEIFFNANNDGAANAELWIYTPSGGGLREIVIDPGNTIIQGTYAPNGGAPNYFTPLNGYLYMSGHVVPEGNELRRYNPAIDDVELVYDSFPGQYTFTQGSASLEYGNDGHTAYIVELNGKLYYTATFDTKELWEYDPATGQGQELIDIFPGVDQHGILNQCSPEDTIVFDGKLFFRGSTEEYTSDLISVEIGTPVSYAPEDIDQDGSVGFSDLTALLAAWGPNPGNPADFDGDGTVGFADLTQLLAAWGPSAAPMGLEVGPEAAYATGYTGDTGEAFIIEDLNMTTIGMLPGIAWEAAIPLDATPDGSIVVGSHTYAGYPGYLFQGWVWTEATGIMAIGDYLVSRGYAEGATWDLYNACIGISDDGNEFTIQYLLEAPFIIDLGATGVETGLTRLDFNDDGLVDWNDLYTADYQGIYWAVYIHTLYPSLLPTYFPEITDPETQLDWDGNGVVEMADVLDGNPSMANLQTYYTEWYVYTSYASQYEDIYGYPLA